MMKDLTTWSKESRVDYSGMCCFFGSGVVNSIINSNTPLYLRPTSRLVYDVPNHVNRIITAESPAAFTAVKKVLEKYTE